MQEGVYPNRRPSGLAFMGKLPVCWALSLGLGPQQGQKKPKFSSSEASVCWGMSQIHSVSHIWD